jgi:hypothetical protein
MKKTLTVAALSVGMWSAGCGSSAVAQANDWRRVAAVDTASLTVRMEGGRGVHLAEASSAAREGEVVHRVLRGEDGQVVFAYDVSVRRGEEPRAYRVVLAPSEQVPTLAARREVLAIADEDLVRVELMEQPETHEKIVDVYRVTEAPVRRAEGHHFDLMELHNRLFRWVHSL